jgi:hypothetical protein
METEKNADVKKKEERNKKDYEDVKEEIQQLHPACYHVSRKSIHYTAIRD